LISFFIFLFYYPKKKINDPDNPFTYHKNEAAAITIKDIKKVPSILCLALLN
jgi:hypothetical protein